MLIKRGKTTQCWRLASSQPLPVPCNPAAPSPRGGPRQQHGAEHAGRSEPGGGKTVHSASREEKGKEYPERNALQHCHLSAGKVKSRLLLSTSGLDTEVAGMKQTQHHGGMGMGTGHVLPCKVLRAPVLLPVKLQTISQHHSWQVLGPNSGARAARHCHTGEAAPQRDRDKPGGRKPGTNPAAGAPRSGDAAFHHKTSLHAHPQTGPATRTFPAPLNIIWLILLLSFFFFPSTFP